MMSQSNLAYARESEKVLLSDAANEAAVAQLLRVNNVSVMPVKAPQRTHVKRRRKPLSFSVASSDEFRPFRIY